MQFKVIISQPSNLYYAWQVEVLLNNMIEVGINLNDVEVVCSGLRTGEWAQLAKTYAARFFFYQNTSQATYPSISRPNALTQHFLAYPELSSHPLLYIDCDVLFLNGLSWTLPLVSGDTCYLSDTRGYIGYTYFQSKAKQVTKNKETYSTDTILGILCDKVGITLKTLKDNDIHSGGAQYFLKGIGSEFWREVEKDCETIYRHFHYQFPESVNRTYFNSENAGFQSFCADMWAVLWNLWKRGKQTKIVPEMAFAWPGWGITDKDRVNLFHNAGVTGPKEGLFYKGNYMGKVPYFDDFSGLQQNKMSHVYVQELIKLRDKTCLPHGPALN